MQPRIWTELDCARLRANLKEIRRHAGRGVQVMAVVKADAYGHGALSVARGLMEAACGGPERFAVATPDEALRLRRAGIERPIQVLGPQLESELHTSLAAGAAITVHSRAEVDALARLARYSVRPEPVSVHVHVDTGMGRMGCAPGDLPDVIDAVHACPHLELEGLSSHYAEAEVAGSAAARRQRRDLLKLSLSLTPNATETLRRRGAKARYVHIGNTAGLVLHANQGFNLVRPGLGLLGLTP